MFMLTVRGSEFGQALKHLSSNVELLLPEIIDMKILDSFLHLWLLLSVLESASLLVQARPQKAVPQAPQELCNNCQASFYK